MRIEEGSGSDETERIALRRRDQSSWDRVESFDQHRHNDTKGTTGIKSNVHDDVLGLERFEQLDLARHSPRDPSPASSLHSLDPRLEPLLRLLQIPAWVQYIKSFRAIELHQRRSSGVLGGRTLQSRCQGWRARRCERPRRWLEELGKEDSVRQEGERGYSADRSASKRRERFPGDRLNVSVENEESVMGLFGVRRVGGRG
jgi:hypothetical protein